METKYIRMIIRDGKTLQLLHVVEFQPLTSNRKLPHLIWLDFQQHIAAGNKIEFEAAPEAR